MTTEYINETSIIICDVVFTLWEKEFEGKPIISRNIQKTQDLISKGVTIDDLPIVSLGSNLEDQYLLHRVLQGNIPYERLYELAYNPLTYQPLLK
jgi:hypothetical protein